MENSGASIEEQSNRDRFTLHIVSPTAQKITFTNLPCSTTISELRTRIFEASPFHPPVESQRLIYRGRPILQPERTLLDVFTQATINESDGLSLHLVTPPVPSYPQHPHPAGQNSLASNTHAAAQPFQQSLHSALPATNVSTRQPQIGQSVPPAQAISHTTHPQAYQLPALQQSFQQFQTIQAQITAQLTALHNQIVTNNHLAHHHGHRPQHQSLLAPGPRTVPASAHQQPAPTPYYPQRSSTTTRQSPEPASHDSGVHSNSNVSPFQAESGLNLASIDRQNPSTLRPSPSESLPVVNPGSPWQNTYQQNQSRVPLQDQRVARKSDNQPPQSHASNSAEKGSTTDTRTERVDFQGAGLGDGTPVSEQQRPGTSAVYVLSSPTGPQALLVSPSGHYIAPWSAGYPNAIASHHARLPLPMVSGIINQGSPLLPPVPGFHFQPQGTTFPQPQLAQPHQVQGTRLATLPIPAQGGVQTAASQQVQQQPYQVPQQHQQPQQPQQQQQPQERQQQARDIVRVLVPLGGHLWLFIRLFGFVWFFTHGASWSRTILLCAIATVVFIGQSGMFRSVFQGLWDPIRRHADNLMPVAGNEQPPPDGRQATPNQAGGATGGEPSPEQVAQRLLEQRRAQGEHVIRHLFRRAERAIALFLASLAPGVAERHIQARDAAEAARQLHLRQRGEREREEREGRAIPPEGNSLTGDGPVAMDSSGSANVSPEPGDDSGALPAQTIEV